MGGPEHRRGRSAPTGFRVRISIRRRGRLICRVRCAGNRAGRAGRGGGTLAWGVVLLLMAGLSAPAQAPHLNRPVRGGMPGLPLLTGIEMTTNGLRLTWEGPPGYYRVEYRTHLNGPWKALTLPTNHQRTATVPAPAGPAFFRVSGPRPQFAGAEACATCHEQIHEQGLHTRHAGALNTLRRIDQADNPACLPCHTVGFGVPGGFLNTNLTPHLAGVQCENCHGPAGQHAASENDPTMRPRVEIAAQMCGGCHNAESHKPHFEQWAGSAHAIVTEDMNPATRINACGRCHSGSARLALLQGRDPVQTVTGDANLAITCVVCHDPHRQTGHPAQLRNPLVSFADYSLSPTTDFGRAYRSDIQVCAQCHNQRGATWTTGTRPPHYSPQYNMLLGTAGLGPPGVSSGPAAHAYLEKQCVTCHMAAEGGQDDRHPVFTGHSFRVRSLDGCRGCHPQPEALIEFTQLSVQLHIQRVKAALDFWALTRAPAALRRYGPLAWEYTIPGRLSNPAGASTVQGPRSSTDPLQDEQRLIPERVRKARFNLYLVDHDGSYGVHHGPHAALLLDTALMWVAEELQMPMTSLIERMAGRPTREP